MVWFRVAQLCRSAALVVGSHGHQFVPGSITMRPDVLVTRFLSPRSTFRKSNTPKQEVDFITSERFVSFHGPGR